MPQQVSGKAFLVFSDPKEEPKITQSALLAAAPPVQALLWTRLMATRLQAMSEASGTVDMSALATALRTAADTLVHFEGSPDNFQKQDLCQRFLEAIQTSRTEFAELPTRGELPRPEGIDWFKDSGGEIEKIMGRYEELKAKAFAGITPGTPGPAGNSANSGTRNSSSNR